MLKKLLKYDLIYMFKCLVVFYGLSIFFGVLTRIFLNMDEVFIFELIGKICSGAAISMMVSIVLNNVLRMWARFIGNLYGDESYLTHTLPIKKSIHYAAKVLTAIISLIISFVVIGLTLFIAYYTKDRFEMFINMFIYKDGTILDVLLVTGVLVLQTIHVLQLGFTGIILGNRHINLKIIYTLIYGFISYIISQICILGVVVMVALINKDLWDMLFVAKDQMEPMDDTIKNLMGIMFVTFIVFIMIVYLINKKLFNKGVNVD